MITNKRLCIACNIPMVKTYVTYKRLKFEARECPRCHDKIFTEDLAMDAIVKLEAKKLKDQYTKQPIKIGNSLGITFPKEIADVFGLHHKKTLKLHPNVKRGIIEISV